MHENQRESSGADAECIDGDEMSCFRDGNVHVVSDVCDDALDDEFSDA
ncbi:Uncharacterised protein [Segatella copri]|nr:Uncharacterised protein [Segatella copri]